MREQAEIRPVDPRLGGIGIHVYSFDVLIAGAGHVGVRKAIMLRQLKFAGSIGLFGEEGELPCERPPLSKEYLSKEKSFDRLLIRPRNFWTEKGISLQLGRRIEAVDPAWRRAS